MIPNGVYQENAYLMWDDSLKSGRCILKWKITRRRSR